MMADPSDLTGRTATMQFVVKKKDLATALGSGDVPVLATPRMIAWLEAVSVAALEEALPEGSTSVGTAIEIDHVAASGVGARVTASAAVRQVDGKTLVFECDAVTDGPDGKPQMIGHGTITRVVVNKEKFLARLES